MTQTAGGGTMLLINSKVTFKVGDRIKVRSGLLHPCFSAKGIGPDSVLVVGCVRPLENPEAWAVDPFYWDSPDYAFARGMTRLEMAGHSQVLYLEGIVTDPSLTDLSDDPERKNRSRFSGYWFEHIEGQ